MASASGEGAGLTPAVEAIQRAGVAHRVVTYPRVDSIEEASKARNVPVAAIAKTLAVRRSDDDVVLVLVGGDRALDWKKLRALLGVSRIALVETGDLESRTGYPRGAVTPFGNPRSLPVVVDAHLADLDEVSVGGGAFGTAIHLAGGDLVAATGATVADVTRSEGD